VTAMCACAKHRGQCSIASQWTFGLTLNPHRGQLRSSEGSRQNTGRLAFITTAARVELPRFGRPIRRYRRGAKACFPPLGAFRIASKGAAARNTTRRCRALSTQ